MACNAQSEPGVDGTGFEKGYIMVDVLVHLFSVDIYSVLHPSAVSATARKLATIIWTMIVKNIPYNPPSQYLFLDQKRKMGIAKRIKKQIAKFDIRPDEIGLGNSLSPSCNF